MTQANGADTTLEEVKRNEHRLLLVYLYYRAVLAICLATAYSFANRSHSQISEYYSLYGLTVLAYGALTLISLYLSWAAPHRLKTHTFAVLLIDILSIGLMEYSNGASNSNLTSLLVVTVAASGILIHGKLATFFAAIATLVVLYKDLVSALFYDALNQEDFLQSAFIGIACFATSFLSQQIANRLRESTALAGQQAKELASLEELNHHIIQRMRTGIIVTNNEATIILINDACWRLFGTPVLHEADHLEDISKPLAQQFRDWQNDPFLRPKPFRASLSSPEVQANFTLLETSDQANTLIFIEDNTRLAQQAQQLKLASLGGLTASIAHEIRNPLGAISHAAQLLMESNELNKSDARMTEIIQQHSVRMNKIIENVLQLSRRKQSHPERLNIQDWVNQFIADYQATLSSPAEIHFQCKNEGLEFRVDPSQINQVLTNLFNNGIRYSAQATSKRTLRVEADLNERTEQPILDIIDQGPGIPEEEYHKVFEPFFTSEKSGTGLGLYIARELCEANQARLDLVPTRQGCCFRITFSHPARQVTI